MFLQRCLVIVLPSILAASATLVRSSSPTERSAALTFSPTDYADWSHEPFNATTYLESAALEAQNQRDTSSPSTRDIPGVYMCQHGKWGPPCWWQPALWQCVNTGGQEFSLGPDFLVFCEVYHSQDCDTTTGYHNGLSKPGDPHIAGVHSWKCGAVYHG